MLKGNGLLDLVVGTNDGPLHYYENVERQDIAVWKEVVAQANPFASGITAEIQSPTLADLTGHTVSAISAMIIKNLLSITIISF